MLSPEIRQQAAKDPAGLAARQAEARRLYNENKEAIDNVAAVRTVEEAPDRWDQELALLEGRTGKGDDNIGTVVELSSGRGIALKARMSRHEREEVVTLITRRNQIVREMMTLVEAPGDRLVELTKELPGVIYAITEKITASPRITIEYLEDHPDSFSEEDIIQLQRAYEAEAKAKMAGALMEIKKFRGNNPGPGVRGTSRRAGEKPSRVGKVAH